MKALYLLYDGDSVDGRGALSYIGSTISKKKAKEHFKLCQNPYSTGRVEIVTDNEHLIANNINTE